MVDRFRLRSSRQVIILAGLSVFGFIAWAAFAEIDQVSRAKGQVIPMGRVQIVQSQDGGVIQRINVKEGDRVRKGQVLVALDRVRLEASVYDAKAKVASLKTAKARIEAELFGRPLNFPVDTADFPDFMSNQRQLLVRRRAAQAQDIAALERMLVLVRQELSMNKPLLQYGDVSRSEVLRLERSVADIEGQIASRRNKYLQDLQTEYTEAGEELVAAEQMLKQRESALAEADLEAPADGIVKNVRFTTIGAVLRPSDEVLQIVPTGDELIVEAKVSPADIAYVRVGQIASVNFDTYDSSVYGSADGRVSYISPDTLVEQRPDGDNVYYRVHIRVDTHAMRLRPGERVQIQPGMTATTEIVTGRNTVLKYLMKPLVKTVDESLGER
jgi:adhesin transport system membrane fusion protein